MTSKQYLLVDWFDGRTLKLLTRTSSLKLAREQARSFGKSYSDAFDLIEISDGGDRRHIHRYNPLIISNGE